MAPMNGTQSKLNRVGFRLVVVLATAVLALPGVASAKPDSAKDSGGPKVTVMTRNLFLGADLGPVIDAGSIPEAIDGAGVIWNEFQATNFPERAVPLAREIERAKPDLVGLQEVALWREQTPSDGGAPPLSPLPGAAPATTVAQDFLAILLGELKKAHANDEVVGVQDQCAGEL